MTHPDDRPDQAADGTPGILLAEKPEDRLKEPPLFEVLLHNDDYTTMEFVVHILMTVFRKDADEATNIMLEIHKSGLGVAGVYPKELAETKIQRTRHLAREAGFPLRCTLQEVGA